MAPGVNTHLTPQGREIAGTLSSSRSSAVAALRYSVSVDIATCPEPMTGVLGLIARRLYCWHMPHVSEVAPDVYRVSVFVPEINLQFNHFLVRDDEPLLFHTGLRGMFPIVREAISRLIEPASIRHIGFSHFESDECGALNSWLAVAPNAEPICGLVGALVSVNDFADRPARALTCDDTFSTGKYRFRFVPTPHVPHGWDAGVMLEETQATLFCSDLFHQWGDPEPLTRDSVIERARAALLESEAGPFANYVPYTHHTGRILERLAGYHPRTLAAMHGTSFEGNAADQLRELSSVMSEVLGPKAEHGHTTATGIITT
jgi:flavorubredoxin